MTPEELKEKIHMLGLTYKEVERKLKCTGIGNMICGNRKITQSISDGINDLIALEYVDRETLFNLTCAMEKAKGIFLFCRYKGSIAYFQTKGINKEDLLSIREKIDLELQGEE